eukprot:30662-Pelagococcus_subviridis.AAC.1
MVYMIESLVFSLLGVATCAGGAMVIYSALAEHLPSSTPAYTFHLVIGVAAAVGFLLGGVLKKAALTVIYRRVDRFPRDPARASPVRRRRVPRRVRLVLFPLEEGRGRGRPVGRAPDVVREDHRPRRVASVALSLSRRHRVPRGHRDPRAPLRRSQGRARLRGREDAASEE